MLLFSVHPQGVYAITQIDIHCVDIIITQYTSIGWIYYYSVYIHWVDVIVQYAYTGLMCNCPVCNYWLDVLLFSM